MNIAVCIKQVPASNEIKMNSETGFLMRESGGTKINPYDLEVIEVALQLKEKFFGNITVITMGPPSAKDVIYFAYSMGVERGILLSDPKFAGADTYSTAYTLNKCIEELKGFDIVFCGEQTTDGDTGQVGPSLAEHLGIPHLTKVVCIEDVLKDTLIATQELGNKKVKIEIKLPCVIILKNNTYNPRLPSLKLKLYAKKKEVEIINYSKLEKNLDINKIGFKGSPTKVQKIFLPKKTHKKDMLSGDPSVLSKIIAEELRGDK
ncbi:MAG: electron transfer flavoprotein subunit beta/FixA family protein [Fusobacteriaceae bacterium]